TTTGSDEEAAQAVRPDRPKGEGDRAGEDDPAVEAASLIPLRGYLEVLSTRMPVTTIASPASTPSSWRSKRLFRFKSLNFMSFFPSVMVAFPATGRFTNLSGSVP